MNEPITVLRVSTVAAAAEAHHFHFRHLYGKFVRGLLAFTFSLLSLIGMVNLVAGNRSSIVVLLTLTAPLWVAYRTIWVQLLATVSVSRLPANLRTSRWTIRPKGIQIESDASRTEVSWDAFKKVVTTPRGLLFYPIPTGIMWLSRDAFATTEDFSTVTQLAKERVPRCYTLR
jgi:hypothetical protein